MFKKKTLSEQINAFLAMNSERRGKIRDRIATLESEAAEIKTSIEAETKQLIDYEMADDASGQDRCQKTMRKLRQKLAEVDGLAEAYRNELNKFGYDEMALVNIREAAFREREARYEKIRALASTRKDTER